MSWYVGAIDQSTSSTRFIVFDRGGAIVASAQKEHRQIFPQPGWSEHDPAEIWTNTQEVVAEALASSGLTAADLAAVGIATQMATSAVWDRNGKPLHNALVWQDTRTTEHVAAMTEDGGPDRFRAKTGLPLAPVFSSQLMRWLLNHLPDAREQAGSRNLLLGTIDGWLQWNLTGEHVTDVTNASITQLMNLATLDWDNELLEVFGIPRRALPQILPSSAIRGIGRGVLKGVPIASSLGDQFGALVGQTCFEPGEAENTYGPAGVLVMNTGTRPVPSASGMWTTRSLPIRRRTGALRVIGSGRSGRIAGAMVAGQSEAHPVGRRNRNIGQVRDRQRRCLHRAGFFRALGALFPARCPRGYRRSDAVRKYRAHRSSRAGGGRVSDPRYYSGDGAGDRNPRSGIACRGRYDGERTFDAVPKRYPEHTGCAATNTRNNVPRRRLCRRPRGRLLAGNRRSRAQLGGGSALGTFHGR